MKLPSFIQTLLEKLVGAFDVAIHTALAAVHNLQISDALQKAAIDAVLAAEKTGGTGTDKFAAAVNAVKADFGPIALGVIQTAVQNAWASLQSAPATTQPAQ